jgi:hypothetical protein
MAPSPTRSTSPSTSAPRGPPRNWSRATSPSTPSATELAWTSSPPARPRPAARSAPARPRANATSDTRSGAGRSRASSIDSRVDRGRFSQRLTGPSEALPSERRNASLAARASWGCPHPATNSQQAGQPPAGPCLGQPGHGPGQAVIAFAGRPVLAAEYLGREQERAAVDRRLLQVLAEGDHSLIHHPDPSPLRPGRPVGGGIDEHGRRTGHQQPAQPTLTEEVIRGDQQEQRLSLDLPPDRGQ